MENITKFVLLIYKHNSFIEFMYEKKKTNI